MKKIYLISIIFLAIFVQAEPKQLVCSSEGIAVNGEKIYQKFSAVFDTEDFSKDNAKYELNWIQKSNDKRMEGKTFRNQMTITPSTISLRYCQKTTKLREMFPNSSCTISSGTPLWNSWDISRKDLSFDGGSCTLEDYVSNNVL